MNKCPGLKLGCVAQLACSLYNPFELFFVCHKAGYLSLVSCIQFPQSSGLIFSPLTTQQISDLSAKCLPF